MRLRYLAQLCAVTATLVGCSTNPIEMSDKHMQRPVDVAETKTEIPQPVMGGVVLPPPKPATKVDTYSVVVANVPAQEILFALARDAKINLDIHTGISGSVTINAINQTLPQILTRISKQVDMRYEIENGTLTVMPDSPYLHNYKIDYVNMERDSNSTILNTTQVGPEDSNNSSKITITNDSKNHFWKTLVKNVEDILRETDKIFLKNEDQHQPSTVSPEQIEPPKDSKKTSLIDKITGSASELIGDRNEKPLYTYREAASVIANPENGILTVRATEKQHEKIQEFIDQIMNNAGRQVLIEATIVEVRLSDNYKQGIDWSALRLGNTGFEISQGPVPSANAADVGTLVLGYANPTSKFGDISSSISLLETFGNVKVLSSPKLSVMNNQTAMLRVVDNLAYFSVEVTPGIPATATSSGTSPTFTTTLLTSPVGFTMSVTPQINDSDSVLLNVRPSITRLIRYVDDPNPVLANPCGFGVANCNISALTSQVPETSTREMESMLKIDNNQIAVLGGLMEDRIDNTTKEVPFLASIPIFGDLFFTQHDDTTTKTELVIFLRPVVIKNASIDGDFKDFQSSLPDADFFKTSTPSKF